MAPVTLSDTSGRSSPESGVVRITSSNVERTKLAARSPITLPASCIMRCAVGTNRFWTTAHTGTPLCSLICCSIFCSVSTVTGPISSWLSDSSKDMFSSSSKSSMVFPFFWLHHDALHCFMLHISRPSAASRRVSCGI
ncbi:hypothetical protein BPORC_1805 [Bifidobacterium porcinum]|nr:hypothetical protein BPORC_1805 [Bifidobacterium porcinum]